MTPTAVFEPCAPVISLPQFSGPVRGPFKGVEVTDKPADPKPYPMVYEKVCPVCLGAVYDTERVHVSCIQQAEREIHDHNYR